jgi:ADP-ribosylglycohydrolase
MTEKQIDLIKGVFYGQAIGDALGLGTEFMNKNEILEYYPNGISEYSQIIQDKHRGRWNIGDWTDDTDQFLCICDSILKVNKVDEFAFADEIFKWFKANPMGIGRTVYNVVRMPQFALFPHKASEIVWKLSKGRNASNGAIMRTSILGTYEFWDYNAVIKNTENIAKVTHWDPRCIGSCVVVTLLIANLLNESKYLTLEELCQIADRYDERIKPFIELSQKSSIEVLNLDESESIGYTLKAMSAGLWAYFNAKSFEEGLLKVVNEGGDADTNASVAGSILGAKFGFDLIPEKYCEGLNSKDKLSSIFEKYIDILRQGYLHQ